MKSKYKKQHGSVNFLGWDGFEIHGDCLHLPNGTYLTQSQINQEYLTHQRLSATQQALKAAQAKIEQLQFAMLGQCEPFAFTPEQPPQLEMWPVHHTQKSPH